jgi:hypothetical protein
MFDFKNPIGEIDSDQLIDMYQDLPIAARKRFSDQLTKSWNEFQKKYDEDASRKTHIAKGSLVFQSNLDKPIHHFKVELLDRDLTTPDDFLGRAETDKNGHFEIKYDPNDAGLNDLPDLELRVFEPNHHYSQEGHLSIKYILLQSFKGEDNVTQKVYDFGVLSLPYWEYDTNSSSPRVFVPEHGDPPSTYSNGHLMSMVKIGAPLEVVKRKHFLQNKLNSNKPSLNNIQNDYEVPKTIQMEKDNPGSSRSDEYFGDRILNGMIATNLDRDPHNPDQYWLFHQWNSYEQDGIHCLPNVDIKFGFKGGKLVPVQIILGMREKGAVDKNSPTTKIKVTNEEGDKWLQAKRVARMSCSLWAELEAHLINTHLNTEQYAVALFRNVRKNPFRYIMSPHIKEVASINHGANTMLLGKDGFITKACALTEESIDERIRQAMGMLDWKNWSPRKPINKDHIYAHSAHLYWKMLGVYVDRIFDYYDKDIRKNWFEIKRFSDELIEHSNPFYMCSYLTMALKRDDSWFSKEERPDMMVEREQVNGKTVALSRITNSEIADEEGIANLKQVAKYVIIHSSFMHSWANNQQQDDGAELKYASLGLRWGNNGVFVPESDNSIVAPPRIASEQIWISTFLSKTKFGFIMRNEDEDIHPILIETLREFKDEFDALGINIDDIQSRTNI